jgi:hypothetical protein
LDVKDSFPSFRRGVVERIRGTLKRMQRSLSADRGFCEVLKDGRIKDDVPYLRTGVIEKIAIRKFYLEPFPSMYRGVTGMIKRA